MTVPICAFKNKTVTVALDAIVASRAIPSIQLKTAKYRAIVASIRAVGVVEPLALYPLSDVGKFALLDGHLRWHALKEIGAQSAVCLIATDHERFTYNRQINRLSSIQEHKMILRAIDKGVSPEAIAQALEVNVSRIRERQRMLVGIAPEVAELLKTRMVSRGAFPILRKMKPFRQIEAAEMMVSANTFTTSYVSMIFAATRPEQIVEEARPKVATSTTLEDIARMERELDKLNCDFVAMENTLGETMLSLVVAKGFVQKLLQNEAVRTYMQKNHGDLGRELAAVVEAITLNARTLKQE